jgi:hypothetical protein
MQRPERGFLTHALRGWRRGGVLARPASVWEADACPAATGDVDVRPAVTGRRMRVWRRRGGGCASSVTRGGGCVSGITRGGGGASGVARGGGSRPASTGRQMCVRRRLGKAERLGRSQRDGAMPAGGRAVSGFSGLVDSGLSGSAGARVPRGRERLGRERVDGFDPDSIRRESHGRKPMGPAYKTRPA